MADAAGAYARVPLSQRNFQLDLYHDAGYVSPPQHPVAQQMLPPPETQPVAAGRSRYGSPPPPASRVGTILLLLLLLLVCVATLVIVSITLAKVIDLDTDIEQNEQQEEQQESFDAGFQEAFYVLFFGGCPLNDSLLYDLTLIGTIEAVMPQIDAVLVAVRPSQVTSLWTFPCVTDVEFIYGPGNFGDGDQEPAPLMHVHGRVVPGVLDGGNPSAASPAFSILPPVASPLEMLFGEPFWDHAIIQTANQTNFNGSFEYPLYAGQGVYVFDVNTGLTPEWPTIFSEDSVGEKYAGCIYSTFNQTVSISSTDDNPAYPRCWTRDSAAMNLGIGTHGTACAACILGFQAVSFSTGDVYTVTGTAPLATYVPVRILPIFTDVDTIDAGIFLANSDVARGVLYAADLKAGELSDSPCVINLSVGGGYSHVINAAIEYALDVGCLIVSSAGDTNGTILFPASHPAVISVGMVSSALAFNGSVGGTYFFQFEQVQHPINGSQICVDTQSARPGPGQELTLVAPGAWSVLPYVFAPGFPILSFWWGSSFSAPYTAGVLAAMLSKNATLTQAQAKLILQQTASPIVNSCNTGVDVNFEGGVFCWPPEAAGAGLLNAVAAVNAVGA
jgi:subtilisin family serine protease